MLELLSPAGSPEAVVAAVQNGADAIYLGLEGFNARRGAKNFTRQEFLEAVKYCRARGCRVYVTMNTLASDRELEAVAEMGRFVSDAGADAVLVQDLGVARVLRAVCPDLPLHASTQMSIHNLAGVHAAEQMGLSRAVLARELTREQIRFIASRAPIEVEVFVHGALCFCHSGQCYLSALIGRRSGNRGACAQPCRMQYGMGRRAEDYPLSLKDNCLVMHLRELEEMGVRCVKIEGRMKRPEYTAITTRIYHRAITEGIPPTERDMETLELAFSRDGFTDGYYTGEKQEMHGVRGEAAERESVNRLFAETRRAYSNGELRRVGVDFQIEVRRACSASLTASDSDGNRVTVLGPVPAQAVSAALTQEGGFRPAL
ncbi:MAG: U32 family peptidase [Oscillospiraceae bacterium]|nr:U32 family peptidase [Oscillospiraceae bacterium]